MRVAVALLLTTAICVGAASRVEADPDAPEIMVWIDGVTYPATVGTPVVAGGVVVHALPGMAEDGRLQVDLSVASGSTGHEVGVRLGEFNIGVKMNTLSVSLRVTWESYLFFLTDPDELCEGLGEWVILSGIVDEIYFSKGPDFSEEDEKYIRAFRLPATGPETPQLHHFYIDSCFEDQHYWFDIPPWLVGGEVKFDEWHAEVYELPSRLTMDLTHPPGWTGILDIGSPNIGDGSFSLYATADIDKLAGEWTASVTASDVHAIRVGWDSLSQSGPGIQLGVGLRDDENSWLHADFDNEDPLFEVHWDAHAHLHGYYWTHFHLDGATNPYLAESECAEFFADQFRVCRIPLYFADPGVCDLVECVLDLASACLPAPISCAPSCPPPFPGSELCGGPLPCSTGIEVGKPPQVCGEAMPDPCVAIETKDVSVGEGSAWVSEELPCATLSLGCPPVVNEPALCKPLVKLP